MNNTNNQQNTNNHQNNQIRQQIYLAALMHDIGKFWQRADDKDKIEDITTLTPSVKKNISNVSHFTQDGSAIHLHSAYTQQFFENNNSILNKFFFQKSEEDNVVNLAIYHHKPKTFLQQLIQLADWWSSGMDRQKAYEKQEYKSDFRNRALINIWKNVNFYDKDCAKINTSLDDWSISLNELSLEKNKIFSTINPNTSHKSYKTLWYKFTEEFQILDESRLNDFRAYVDTLYYLLQKYLWCIPASTLKEEIHDSNLFEHSKTTAALALCLYDYCLENKILKIDDLNKNHRPVLLIAIDIIGIQSFIYNISSKGAAKALKGRSFYLQLLMDTIINEILYDLNYYCSNVLYSSGGKAYLLLPNIPKVTDALKNYHSKLEKWLFEKFNGDLYVSFGKVAFFFDKDKRDAEGERGKKYLIESDKNYHYIGDLWKAALDDASKKKNQRFKSVILNDSKFFEPFGEGGEHKVCDLTGIELSENTYYEIDEYVFHESVGEQIELGRILKQTSYFGWTKDQNQSNTVKSLSIYNFKGNKSLKILNSEWFFYNEDSIPSSIDNAIIYKSVQDNFDFLTNTIAGNSIKAFRFYAGASEIKSFEDLVDKESDFKRLAALVMDVDNLGKIFIDGFKLKYFVFKTFFQDLKNKNINSLEEIKNELKAYLKIDNISKDLDKFLEENFKGDENKEIRDSLKSTLLNELNEKFKNFNPNTLFTNFQLGDKLNKEDILSLKTNILPKYTLTVIDNSSFSRLSTLSFYLDLFFSGYINVIKDNFSKLMLIYSGGDDLLAIGEWKEILQFAEDLRNDFYEFVCQRTEISISAGISLFTPKYPVSKAVDEAKESETMAKNYNNQEKGNITFFNVPVIWKKLSDNEFDKVKSLKDSFVNFYNQGLINSSFIQRFQLFYEAKEQSKKTGNLSYRWNIAYYLKRYEKRLGNKKTNEFSDFLGNIYKDLRVFINNAQIDLFTSERNYDLYALAARWAELELRSNNQKKL